MTDYADPTIPADDQLARSIDIPAKGHVLMPARVTYTVPEVAALLGISRATTYAMLRAGEIPARRIGSRWIIACRRFDAWLQSDATADAS
jgi:excisionase family DNA binding protein